MEQDLSPSQPNKEKLQLTPQEKVLFSQLFINLSRAFIQTHTFGVEHMYAKDAAEQSYSIMQKIFADQEDVVVCIADGKLCYGMIPIEEKNLLVLKLVTLFAKVRLTSLRFKKETTLEDFKKLLEIFHTQLINILNAGGVEELAKKGDITTIDINPVKYELVGEDEKIIGSDVEIFEMDEDGEESEEEKEPEDQLLQLISEIFKEGTVPLELIDKIKEDPQECANALVETIKIIDKVGMEKSEAYVSSAIGKLIFIKNELGIALDDDKSYENSKEINKFSNALAKQLGSLSVSQECQPFADEITNLNIEIEDRIKAESVVTGINKENIDAKKKGKIVKSITQRSKVSPHYESLINGALIRRGFTEDEANQILEEGLAYLKKKTKSKLEKLDEKLSPLIEKISNKEIDSDKAQIELNKIIEAKAKAQAKKTIEEKEKVESQLSRIKKSLNSLDYGIVILDDEGAIAFLNTETKKTSNLKMGDKLSETLIEALGTWPLGGQALASPEEAKIISCIKSVQKSDSGQIEGFILKPVC